MGDPTEHCPAGLSDPGHVAAPHGAPFECTGTGQPARQEGDQHGRKPAQMNREFPSQLKNMEMEGQCQSSDVAGKN